MKIDFNIFRRKLQNELLHYGAAVIKHYTSKQIGVLGSSKTAQAAAAIKTSYAHMEDDLYAAVQGEVKNEQDRIINLIDHAIKELSEQGESTQGFIARLEHMKKQIKGDPTDGLQITTEVK